LLGELKHPNRKLDSLCQ